MSWVLAIGLALVAFAIAAFVFRLPRAGWTTLAAALALGLAGYALQASPALPGAPAQAPTLDPQLGGALIEARQAMVAPDKRSLNPRVITADAFAREGQYDTAATLLGGAVAENPRDADAWLALGNALVEHADGTLTPPALLAYRKSAEADPDAAGPGYFIGLALIRQGQMAEARETWRETLAAAGPDAAGRDQLETLLARLDQAMAGAASQPQATP